MKKVLSILASLFIVLESAGQISCTASVNNSNCNGANDGSISITVSSGNPPITYTWNIGDTLSSVQNLAPGNYSVAILDGIGNDTTLSFTIAEKECPLSGEQFFSPNGDGVSDVWFISNLVKYPDYLLLIYNRWGQKVHECSGKLEYWDGRDEFGRPVPEGAYFYVLYPVKSDKKTFVKGSVSVIR